MSPMKTLVAIAVCVWAQSVEAQPDLWEHARRQLSASGRPRIGEQVYPATLMQRQRESVIRLLKTRLDVQDCLPSDPTFFEKLQYSSVPLAAGAKVVLVEAGTGCFRGGQGSNGSMWLVRFDGLQTTLLVTPQEAFVGYVYSIEPTTSKGYRDIILGWHMSAFEAGLGYFRFDDRSYRRIGTASLRKDENGTSTLIPESVATHP